MTAPERVMIIAWGSRGDIQPIVSLAVRLREEGRKVIVFATPPATDLLEAQGIDHVAARENIADFADHMFGTADLSDRSIRGLLRQIRQARTYFESPEFLDIQKADAIRVLEAARDFAPDVMIVPNTMYGPFARIAEALQVPVVTMDLQVNHPSSDYPTFIWEIDRFPKWCNRTLYRIRTLVYRKLVQSKLDITRDICALPPRTYADGTRYRLWPHDLPQLCAVSPSICPKPQEWPEHKAMGGWLFTPGNDNYMPPPGLPEFLLDRPVCIGFGSMKGNPEFRRKLSTLVITALKLAGVKGVLLGGWAGLTREALDRTTDEGQALYDWAAENVFELDACPHDWLFPQCSAVVHHGGAGTLAAGIRSGVPTIVCSILLDQPFHGSLVREHGIGKYMGAVGSRHLTACSLADAITSVTTDPAIAEAAEAMGKQVRAEDGPGNAVRFIDQMATTYAYPWPVKRRISDRAEVA